MKIVVTNITCQAIIGGLDNAKCNVYNELRAYLRVRPSNYGMILHQMRSHGNSGWDGYTYFFTPKGKFPTGFLPLVLEYLKSLGVSVVLEDKRVNVPEFKDYDYVDPIYGSEVAEHQQLLISKTNNYTASYEPNFQWHLYFPRGVWKAATNARKTNTAGNLIKSIKNPKCIMLVDSQGLLEQHLETYQKYFPNINDVGTITSKSFIIGTVLTIAMVRTLYNRLKGSVTLQRNLHDKFNMLICDEVHGMIGGEALYVINHINAGLRVGMSGTPFEASDKIGKFRLIGMFGPKLHEVTKRYLMDNGFSMIPKLKMYLNPTKAKGLLSYDAEYAQVVTESVERAELVADIIAKYHKRKCLISFFNIAHGQLMYDTFVERYPALASMAGLAHGTSVDKDEVIAAFGASNIKYLFASSIFQQGFNIPDIGCVIYAIGEKAAIPNLQVMGRAERLDGINNTFIFVDIFDQGKYATKHSKKRIIIYQKEDLPIPIEFKYPNRKGTPI